MPLSRRTLLAATSGLPLLRWTAANAAEPILAGVSGPLTGQNEQYGTQWRRGFDLALDGINSPGTGDNGVKTLPIAYDFEFILDDVVIGKHSRRRWKWRDIYDMDFTGDPDRRVDRRLIVATAVGLDALQAR